MTLRVSGAALVALVLATITGCDVQYDGNDAVSHQSGSDYFAVGGLLNVTEAVHGDAILAGGRVSTASEVHGDLVAAAGELSVGGAIGDDLYAAGGNYALARTELELALATAPDYAIAHENLADVYARLAVVHYERAAALDPRNRALPQKLKLSRDLIGVAR